MKRMIWILAVLLLCAGCAQSRPQAQIAATTLPVYEFTAWLCRGTDLTVTRLVTENVSCLHDYSLNVKQVKAAEAAEVIVTSGAGLEEFMEDLLADAETVIDSGEGITLLECGQAHEHDHGHDHHEHGEDPHIWLSPECAKAMAQNICGGLSEKYPLWADRFEDNLPSLLEALDAVQSYGQAQLSTLSCREMITFHDGFSYFAHSFDLTILEAVEEESGSEASARELVELITTVRQHSLPAVFTETNGSASAADVICAETGAGQFALDMAMSGDSYFDAMYRNIDTIREAMG